MSKAAELTREELVERLSKAAYDACRKPIDRKHGGNGTSWHELYEPQKWQWQRETEAVLSELKALGLAVVPVEPTTRMWSDGDMEIHAAADPSDIWKVMLRSSPFSGN